MMDEPMYTGIAAGMPAIAATGTNRTTSDPGATDSEIV